MGSPHICFTNLWGAKKRGACAPRYNLWDNYLAKSINRVVASIVK